MPEDWEGIIEGYLEALDAGRIVYLPANYDPTPDWFKITGEVVAVCSSPTILSAPTEL